MLMNPMVIMMGITLLIMVAPHRSEVPPLWPAPLRMQSSGPTPLAPAPRPPAAPPAARLGGASWTA